MPDTFTIDPNADDQKLLAQVVAYYAATLKATPDAQDYLRGRGVTHPDVIDHFCVGYSDRSLGLKLPAKQVKAGAAIRERLHRLGLFRESGHEHFRGSLTFPVPAADGSGAVADIYGRKILDGRLRTGTALHTHLGDRRPGVWNVEAFAASKEIVLCSGLWDALTFWSHGYHNATCMFGEDALTDDLLAAFAEFNTRRVLTPCRAVARRLLDAGLEVFVFRLPHGLDVNAYARQSQDPADALGGLLRCAEWEGKGMPSTTPPAPAPHVEEVAAGRGEVVDADDDAGDDEVLAERLEAGRELADPEPPPEPPVVRTASPVPPAPAEIEAEVGEDELAVTFGNRRYRVRGMSKNATPDALRVNVLVTTEQAMHVDTFDLYSAKHRRSFQEQAATELHVEEAVVKRDLGRVLLKLEEVQDARHEAARRPARHSPDMPAPERDAALALLRDPHLLDRVVADFTMVGERTNKLVGYLAAVSRKLDTPLAVIVQSTSAAGKSTLMEAVLGFVPPEDVVKFSAMTGQSLYYMGDDALKNKILAIVEEEGAAKASYALKLLQSEGELRIASTGKEANTGRLVTQEYRVEGPVMILLTTTSITVDEELVNRCLVLTVDEDREQTRAIQRVQRAGQTIHGLLASRQSRETLKLHRNAQRLLRPLLVANPYAERLTFTDSKTRTRRDNQKYLTLIRAIALLHQHQRPVRSVEHGGMPVEYIEVTLGDIERANELAHEVLGRSLDELPPQTRRLLCSLGEMVSDACREQGLDRADFRFTRRQVREHTGWGDTQLKVHLRRLAELEYVAVHRDREAKRFVYELLFAPPSGAEGKVLAGLIDVEELRRDRSGGNGDRSARIRGPVGPQSGEGRGAETGANPSESSTERPSTPERAEGANGPR